MGLEVKVMLESGGYTSVDDCPRSAVAFSVSEVLVCGVEAGMMAFPADDDYNLWLVGRIGGGGGLTGLFDEWEFLGVDGLKLAVRDAVAEVVDFLGKLLLGVVCFVVV